MTNFKAILTKLIVQRDPKEENTGGLMLPSDVEKPPRTGIVLSAGEGVTSVKEGDRVAFHEYSGYFLKASQDLEESDIIVMREDEVLAVESKVE